MAVRHLYTLLCDYAFVDGSGKLGLLGVFQNILLDKVPGAIPQFFIALGIVTDADAEIRVAIVNADESWEYVLVQSRITMEEVGGGVPRGMLGANLKVANLEFPAPGEYQVVIDADGERLHSLPFTVQKKET